MDNNLKTTPIGNTPTQKLEAKKCIIENVEIELVEKAKSNKAVFELNHPDKEEPIKISSVALLRQKKDKKEIVNVATWCNLDKEGKLQMDSSIALLLKFYNANNLTEMIGKEVQTEIGTDGYLSLKAY